jgi:pimeloyl-ACP methyl ester carboxylesterase
MPEDAVKRVGGVRRMVPVPSGLLHVADYPGAAPALVLMHGFPDDSRIYDRLVPLLPARRILVFDWLGYGRSDSADSGARGVDHQHELRAVLDSLQLGRVVLVGHDASGPDAIDFAVTEPGRVGQLVLLNTYYGHAPSLRLPEMIRLLADPGLTPLADAMMAEPGQRLWLLAHTGTQFGMDPADQGGIAVRSLLPQFFGDESQPEALAAIRAWTADLEPQTFFPRLSSKTRTSTRATWRPSTCPSRWFPARPTITSAQTLRVIWRACSGAQRSVLSRAHPTGLSGIGLRKWQS